MKRTTLFQRVPAAKKAWDYERNIISPEHAIISSDVYYYFKCDQGHSYERSSYSFLKTQNCPECKKIAHSVFSCPDLMKFWDYSKNTLDPKELSTKSTDNVWWLCKKCGYSWQALVVSRKQQKASKCPCCETNSVIKEGVNDFITMYPQLGLDYKPELNPGIDAGTLGAGAHVSVKWKCHICGYEWDSQIYGRIRRYHGERKISKCPVCGKNKRIRSFEEEFPDLIPLYSPNNPMKLSELTRGDYQSSYLWVCNKHGEFPASMRSMIRSIRGGNTGCPFCHGNKVKRTESFGALYPELAKEWDPDNLVSPYELTCGSKYNAKWICKNGHKWEGRIYERVNGYKYCKVCYPHGLNPELFRDFFPEARAWYTDKNPVPFDLHIRRDQTPSFWKCPRGHEFEESCFNINKRGIMDCPVCTERSIIKGINDLGTTHPKLALEWSPNNVRDIGTISKNNFYYASWVCSKCGREYKEYVPYREEDDERCPVCFGSEVLAGYNDLATTDPELAKEWSPNNELQLTEVRKDRKIKVKWICPTCGGEYSCRICDREVGDESCKYCYGDAVQAGYNDLATTDPELAKEWSPNNVLQLTEVRKDRKTKAQWICPTCGGEYSYNICDREVGDESCKYCYGNAILAGYNDLATTDPELAKEWSPNNVLRVTEVRKDRKTKAQWICPTCGVEYGYNICDREVGDESCPVCHGTAVLAGYNDLATTDPELAKEWSPNNVLQLTEVRKDRRIKVKWICPTCGGEYSCRICDREVGDESCKYCYGGAVQAGYNDLATTDPELAKEWSPNNVLQLTEVRKDRKTKAQWICPTCGGEYSYNICDREVGDESCKYCYGNAILAGYNDLATTDPELAKEWSPNNVLQLTEVRKDRKTKAQWICPTCGVEYGYNICDREVGDESCPVCHGTAVLAGYNDLATTDPELAKEWSPNNVLRVTEVRKDWKTKAQWICPTCGGEYDCSVCDREVGDDNCLYCSGKKILPGYNSLKALLPELMLEWSWIENAMIGIDPDRVLCSDRSSAWWKCTKCGYKYTKKINIRVLKQKRKQETCSMCNGLRQKRFHFL